MNLFKKLHFNHGKENRKLRKDNSGSSFVLVMVTIALIMILLAVIFVMIFLQYRMLRLSKQSKSNFYYLEEVLDEMRAGVGNESVRALKTSYDETQEMVVYYDTDKKRYMSTSAETAMDILDNKFLDKVAKTYCTTATQGRHDASISPATLQNILKSYVKQLNYDEGDFNAGRTSDGVQITFGSNFQCKAVTTTNPVKTIGYTMTGIKVSRKDPKTGNLQSISTDISIYPPKDAAFNFLASGEELDSVFTYAMVADYGIEVGDSTGNTQARVVGNIYAGSDTRDNGIYHGTVTQAPAGSAGKFVISGPTVYSEPLTTPNASQYSGLFVTGGNDKNNATKLNLQADVLDINGDIATEGAAQIHGSNIAENSRVATSTIYAKNISTVDSQGLGISSNLASSKIKDENSKDYNISLNGMFNISDDLELLADNSSVALLGSYFGYNYAAEEESQTTASADASQITSVKETNTQPKRHTNSSAIIINGQGSTLNLKGLSSMVINGRSYIDLTSENGKDAKNLDNTDEDIKMSESIAQKGSQLLYRATDEGNLSAGNPSSKSSLSMYTSGDGLAGVYGKNQTLTTKVPYYNMIKFLTYRFVKDGLAMLYKSDNDNVIKNNVFKGNDDISESTEKTFSNIWDDMENNSTGISSSKYYAPILNYYFPQGERIVTKEKNVGSAGDTKKVEITLSKAVNKTVKVIDAYNNDITIWRNDNTEDNGGKGVFTGATKDNKRRYAHRYGFIPVTEDGNMVELVQTRVGGKYYYYFQFYDEDSKKQFVLDYADYLKATVDGQRITQAQDGSSVDTFSVDQILLPNDNGENFTRGISAVLSAGAKDYTLLDSVNGKNRDEASLMKDYETASDNYKVYRCYFPENDYEITQKMRSNAEGLFTSGTRTGVVVNNYNYTASGENISPLNNPDCINISWDNVAKKRSSDLVNGDEVKGYPGTNVWISNTDIVIDGNDAACKNKNPKGIILCQGNVTIKDVTFRGTVICAGKLKILGSNTSFYTDQLMCQHMLENDTDNQIRTCLGLSEYQQDASGDSEYTSLSSIKYTDLVGYENWLRNYGD